MAQATASPYRILTHRQRHRRTWHSHQINKTHQVAYDPTVYSGVVLLTGETDPARWPSVDIVATKLGDLGLVRVAS